MSRFLYLTVAAVLAAGNANAAVLTGADLLNQFNVITLGDLDFGEEIDGRVYVGGNMNVSQTRQVYSKPYRTPASSFDELVVEGNITGEGININNAGDVSVRGSVTNTNLELNGNGTATIGGTLTAKGSQGTKLTGQSGTAGFDDRFPTDVAKTMTDLSTSLAAETTTAAPTLTSGGTLEFKASGSLSDVFVFSLAYSDFSNFLGSVVQNLNIGGLDGVSAIINVTGVGANNVSLFGFAGGGNLEAADNVIWNFADATGTLSIQKQFFGSILAPLANVTNTTPFEGTLVAKTASLRGEAHVQGYTGTLPTVSAVPLPAGVALLAFGMAALGVVGLSRRRHA
ncbi:hypothetical protein P775_17215 [Puniceibacterium antarcticum]|uniref:Choice-of-anchor A domain-containing protein n=1 Tax=Puniceibacterium antarcticum TaxID=1206336 RepID=A0A2G8RBX8_9RHOB|nr:collagen-binding domain-containing protein [Puniceibacterium antarcticum]PIL18993.1 hypothetical protein P775_17215 [Puniceibacterium antarcticum]